MCKKTVAKETGFCFCTYLNLKQEFENEIFFPFYRSVLSYTASIC